MPVSGGLPTGDRVPAYWETCKRTQSGRGLYELPFQISRDMFKTGKQDRSAKRCRFKELSHSFVGKSLKMSATMDGSKSGSPLDFARLFKVFTPTHLFFKTATFDQFTKPSNCFLNRLFVTND
jgi:hypothetical protein